MATIASARGSGRSDSAVQEEKEEDVSGWQGEEATGFADTMAAAADAVADADGAAAVGYTPRDYSDIWSTNIEF